MSNLSTKRRFEILALETSDNTGIKSEINLLNLFLSYGQLWANASLDEQNFRITDGDTTVEVQRLNSDVGVDKTFVIKVTTHIPHIFCPIKDYGLEPCENSVGKQRNL